MMRVCISPIYRGEDRADGGIRRVVNAMTRYLPEFGWDITDTPESADLVNVHGTISAETTGIPVVSSCHGMYWHDYDWDGWAADANNHVRESLIRADAITAPSQWVAHAITRGILAQPTVIYHGVEADEWATTEDHLGYVLWNKARIDPVSDPYDMNALAHELPDIRFISTFGQQAPNVYLTGAMPHEQMKPVVQHAGVYLATTRETFGIGTLEALAAGVPVVGWRYGGQQEIVRDGETGYLAEYGDYHGLVDCIRRALSDRGRLARNAVSDARERWGWRDKISQYAALFTQVAKEAKAKRPKVSVVITNHNLGHFLEDCMGSVVNQTMSDWEMLVVDDGSREDDIGKSVVELWHPHNPKGTRIRYLPTPHNLGLSGARNFGWQHASGKYIIFLDADDMLAPNALDILSHALDYDPSTHIVFGRLETMSADGSNRQRTPWPGGEFNYDAQIAHLNQLPYASLMRRTVLERSGGYRTRDWRAEDASFWTRVTSFGFRARMVTDDTTLIYRMHDAQKSKRERAEHSDGDGDWTAWFPWRLAGEPREGLHAMEQGLKPNPMLVPWGAQGTPPLPLKAWPVRHHQHPMVSVIIPVGPGHAEYLIDALDSVQAQTLPDWECIVIMDGQPAPPETRRAHPWAHFYLTGDIDDIKQPRGAGHARNVGLEHARAPLILFLDADDILIPTALELMLKSHITSGGKYVYSDWLLLEDERRIDGPAEVQKVEEYDPRKMVQGLRHAVTALIPTEWAKAVGGFDEQLPIFEDWDFYSKLAIAGYCGHRAPWPLFIYRLKAGSRTRAAIVPHGPDDPIEYTPLGVEAAGTIEDRYAAYRTGEESFMGCCGGNQATLADAQAALSDMVNFATAGAIPAAGPASYQMVRVEFIGDQQGAMTYYGKVSGLAYSAGRDPISRYLNVDPRDVEHLLSLGKFRVVPEPLNFAEPETVIAGDPQWEETQPRQRGRGHRR